jgi:hypothetical protein
MQARGVAGYALGGLLVVMLTACGGSTAKGSSTTGSPSTTQGSASAGSSAGSSTSTTAASGSTSGSGGASFQAQGCAAPSAGDIGSAFGAAITKTTPTADNGCLWEAGSLAHSVQVSYHPASEFNPTRLAILKAGATPLSVPGANDAFVKHVSLPGGANNDVEYIIFDAGTVQIAFGGPSGTLTDQNESAVTNVIVG